MKSKVTLFVAMAITAGCTAQQPQDRPVQPFDRIQVSGAVNVVYSPSDSIKLTVEASEKNAAKIETKVEGRTLIITSKGNLSGEVTVRVKSSTLRGVDVSGASDFRATAAVKTDSLDVEATGASDVHMEVEASRIRCNESGASDIVLKGKADALQLDVSGAASFKGYSLTAVDASVVATGASNAKVNVTGTIRANATGASEVKIKGDPKEISGDASSAAKVSRIAQNGVTDGTNDTVVYNWKGRKIIIVGNDEGRAKKKDKHHESSFYHWRGIAVGVNGFLSPAGTIALNRNYSYMDVNYSRSFNWQFNLIEQHVHLVRNRLNLVVGGGIDYHLYQFEHRTTLKADSSFTWGVVDSSNAYSWKKNKLRATYLQVPLLLEFNTSNNPDKAWHIAAGVVGQYRIGSRTKQVLEDGHTRITRVRKDEYNISPFAAKAHLNFGYRGWTVFGEYSLTQLFRRGMGPEIYPFTAGIRIIPFG